MNASKKRWAILLALALLLIPLAPEIRAESLTNSFIQEILSQDEEKINLNQELLIITEKAHRDLLNQQIDVKDLDNQLQFISDEIAKLINPKVQPKEIITIINRYLFDKISFTVDRTKLFESTLDSLLLSNVLSKKKGQCLSLSLIYLCIAERLHLPLSGVMVPNHFFVRLNDTEEGINIETTFKGKNFSDQYYQKYYLKGFDDKVSLKNLSKKETIAIYLSNIANHYKLKGNHKKAMDMFTEVIKTVPNRASLYTNLGNTYERDNQIIKAIVLYQQSLHLNPYLCETHYNLALAHFYYTKMYAEARKQGEMARKLGCRLHPEFEAFLNSAQK